MTSHSPANTLHIYTRVSTLAQADKGTSLDSQFELGVEKAKALGFSFEHWDEGGKSSHHEDISGRPVLAQLYAAIKAGRVKHLWVYDQSRLSRNDQVASVFRYECNKQGVTLYTKDGQFDLSSPQDKFLKQLLDAVAEFDNTTRAERTRLGKMQRVRAGHWHGGPPPFGYQLKDRKLVVDQDEAKWVRRMFEMSASGMPPAAIKNELDTNGVLARRGGLWSIGSIAAMLRNPHYAGQYSYRDKKSEQELTVICPQLVDVDVWELVQTLHRRQGNRHQQKNATTKNFYLLRDLMYCGHCGRPLAGRLNKGNAEALYYCTNKERSWVKNGGKSETPWKRGTGCGFERAMNIFQTDELVWRYVQDLHAKSSLLKEEVKRRVLSEQGLGIIADPDSKRKAEVKVRKLQKDLAKLSGTIGGVEATRLLGRMDEIAYKSTMKLLLEEKDKLDATLAEIKLELLAATAQRKWVNWVDAFGADVRNTSNYTDDQRKEYVAGVVERIDVRWLGETRSHELTIKFRLPIVGDGIQWIDPKKKAKGYRVVEGETASTLTLSKKNGRG